MIDKITKETIVEKEISITEEISNAITGNKNYLINRLRTSIKNAKSIDIIVSFLMESGVKMLLNDLKEALYRGVNIRILTGNYLNITQPSALYLLKDELKNRVDLRFYNNPKKSFHPKAYMFHNELDSEIYIGSSNISRGALTSSIEWNYRFNKSSNPNDFNEFYETFEDLFYNHSYEITDEVLKDYSKSWKKPKVQSDIEKEENNVLNIFEPRGAQIEALYGLKQSREEGYDKGLVVAATGIGKTYLAAFDSREYERVLFIAHTEEILKQAAISFKNVRNSDDIGFFYSNQKDTKNKFIFSLVQTLGKDEYLKEAIEKGWLVPFRYYGIYDETVNYENIDYKNGKYDDKQLEEALMLNKRGEVILNHYLKYNSKRAIGFCTSRHHAEYMAKVFNENNIPSAAVYSGEKGEYSEERNIALSKLTSGEVKVIFSVDMFNEGLDVPAIDMVMFLRPTQSPTIFLQQLGINR